MEPRETEELLGAHLWRNDLPQDEPRSWTIGRSPLGGRGMFATRDIPAGELIFTDAPLLIGPRCCSKRPPMCVVCYRNECPLFPCDHGCGLPICSTECENSAAHAGAECRFLREWSPTCGSTWSRDLLLAVVAIRGLALSQEQRKLLYALECHSDLIRNYEIDLLERNVGNPPSEEQVELMKRICGVFNTNSFEVVVARDQRSSVSLRGLYPMGALQNHCCVPNTRHHFDDRQRLHVSAAMPIAAGDELTMSYTDLLWDTSRRRQFLRVTKLFACDCRRCVDPLRNRERYTRSLSSTIECIRSGLKAFVLDAMRKSPREILKFIETTLSILVPASNYIMMDMKYCIISYFGRAADLKWEDLTDAELKIKGAYCHDILSVLEALGFGDSIKKGLVLYELYRTNVESCKRHVSEDRRTHSRVRDNDNEHLLRKAMSILQNDVGAACVRGSD
ncbi:Protein msta, isoform A [Ooceraea biroi]|uniref:Protein msta, isoform A n=1 Tax=Ooceraea biroi TaxID=2015173 RepID=A0A026WKD8_OOCBI|nr:Protein msta, isoform A [Ooceraea biroi]